MRTGLEHLVEKLGRAGTMPATPAAMHTAPPPTHFAPQAGAQPVAGFHPDAVARMVQSHPDAQARLRSFGYGTSPGAAASSLGASAAQSTQAAHARYLGPEAAANALREHSEVQAGNNVVVSDPEMAAGAVRGQRPAQRHTSGTIDAAAMENRAAPPPSAPTPPAAGGGGSSLWRYALPGAAVAAGLGAAAMAGNREDDKYRNLVYAPAPYG